MPLRYKVHKHMQHISNSYANTLSIISQTIQNIIKKCIKKHPRIAKYVSVPVVSDQDLGRMLLNPAQ